MTQMQSATPALPSMPHKLMVIIDELTKLMEEETPLIEARDFTRHVELLRRKQELTLDYQAALKVIAENPATLEGLSQTERGIMRGAGERLDHVTRRNAEVLNFAARASERLMHAIMEEVRRELQSEGGYASNGLLTLQQASKAKPVAFNERV